MLGSAVNICYSVSVKVLNRYMEFMFGCVPFVLPKKRSDVYMIYITGDVHGSIDIEKLSNKNFPEGKNLTRRDYVIVCGDFGLPFLPSDTWPKEKPIPNKNARSSQQSYQYWIQWLSERPFTLLWIDGNHDNHPFWYEQPVVEWNGGLVNIHPDAQNVIHLKRGEYYNIDGHTFWCMGGALSHDKSYRTEGYSWWPEEIPSYEEMMHGRDTLQQHGNQVDFILTHTMPQTLLAPVLRAYYEPEPTRNYLDQIYAETDFKYWFCGHFHLEVNKPAYRIRVLYNEIISL